VIQHMYYIMYNIFLKQFEHAHKFMLLWDFYTVHHHIRLCVLIFRTWSKRVKVAKENPEERTKLIKACPPSETDRNIIRHEVRYK